MQVINLIAIITPLGLSSTVSVEDGFIVIEELKGKRYKISPDDMSTNIKLLVDLFLSRGYEHDLYSGLFALGVTVKDLKHFLEIDYQIHVKMTDGRTITSEDLISGYKNYLSSKLQLANNVTNIPPTRSDDLVEELYRKLIWNSLPSVK